MNENHDGWVLLGADRKPVMRKDRSRVSFRFRDAARLAEELAASDETDATAVDPVPLAPLDSGYNRDWDPQAQKSFLADITKACRLLAYQYVQFTEPQEAVRRAVSDILQNPTYVKKPQMNAWVPGKFDAEAVKLVASTLHKRVIGPQPVEAQGGGEAAAAQSAVEKQPTEHDGIANAWRRKGEKFRHGAIIGSGSALTEAPIQIVGGVRDALQEAWVAIDHAANDSNERWPLPTIELGKPASEMFALPEVPQPKTASGAAIRAVSRFVTGFVPALKIVQRTKLAALVPRVGHALEEATASSIASAIVLDPFEARISNLIEEFPELQNPITEYLSAKSGDGEAEGRFKNAIEGFALGAMGETLGRALHAYIAMRHFKELQGHQGDARLPFSDEPQPDVAGDTWDPTIGR